MRERQTEVRPDPSDCNLRVSPPMCQSKGDPMTQNRMRHAPEGEVSWVQLHANRMVVLVAGMLASNLVLFAPHSGAVSIDWMTVGAPGFTLSPGHSAGGPVLTILDAV